MSLKVGGVLLLLVGVLAGRGAMAEPMLPVLRYDPPVNFYRSAIQPPDDYAFNEAAAWLQVYPFRPFTGDIQQMFRRTLLREWIDPRFREGAPAAPPTIGRAAVSRRAGSPDRPLQRERGRTAQAAPARGAHRRWRGRDRGPVGPVRRELGTGLARHEVRRWLHCEWTRWRGRHRWRAGPGAARDRWWRGCTSVDPDGLQAESPASRGPGGCGPGPAVLPPLGRRARLPRVRTLARIPGGNVSRFDYEAAQRDDPDNTGR